MRPGKHVQNLRGGHRAINSVVAHIPYILRVKQITMQLSIEPTRLGEFSPEGSNDRGVTRERQAFMQQHRLGGIEHPIVGARGSERMETLAAQQLGRPEAIARFLQRGLNLRPRTGTPSRCTLSRDGVRLVSNSPLANEEGGVTTT